MHPRPRPRPHRVTSLAVVAMLAVALPIESGERPRQPVVEMTTAPAPPRAYLAWTPGGLPAGFRAWVRTIGGLRATVVFAGDTLWLTRSFDASGGVVDDSRPPYAMPIDAFAVHPREVAPFLPAEVRRGVIDTLARGQAVLGTRSAAIRRLGIGGVLEFGDRAVRVGAVVPDEVIGWSEVLVSRDAGRRLGVVDDRYLLAIPEGNPSLPAFERMLRPLVPSTVPMRVERPGGTPYMRVASGVDPPVVLKEVFGEFSAALDPVDPAFFRVDPVWARNLVTRTVPLLGRLTCHRRFMADLVAVMRTIEREGLGSRIHSTAGCFNARTVGRSPSNPPSFHAYGAAVDINAPENALGTTPTMDRAVVGIFEAAGFTWGGDFLIADGMHFEYGGGPPPSQADRGGRRRREGTELGRSTSSGRCVEPQGRGNLVLRRTREDLTRPRGREQQHARRTDRPNVRESARGRAHRLDVVVGVLWRGERGAARHPAR